MARVVYLAGVAARPSPLLRTQLLSSAMLHGALTRDSGAAPMLQKCTAILVAAVATATNGWASTASAEVSMFRDYPAHTGVYPGRAILNEPKLKWKFRTSGQIIASPTVDHGIVYVGSTDGIFYAVDAKTGA